MMPMLRDQWKRLVVSAALTGIACAVFTAALTATTRIAVAQGGGRPCFPTMGANPGQVSNFMTYSSSGGPNAPNGPGFYGSFDSKLTYTPRGSRLRFARRESSTDQPRGSNRKPQVDPARSIHLRLQWNRSLLLWSVRCYLPHGLQQEWVKDQLSSSLSFEPR